MAFLRLYHFISYKLNRNLQSKLNFPSLYPCSVLILLISACAELFLSNVTHLNRSLSFFGVLN